MKQTRQRRFVVTLMRNAYVGCAPKPACTKIIMLMPVMFHLLDFSVWPQALKSCRVTREERKTGD